MNLISQAIEKLHSFSKEVALISDFYAKNKIEAELVVLEKNVSECVDLSSKEFIKDAKKLKELKDFQEKYQQITATFKELTDLEDFFSQAEDATEFIVEVERLGKKIEKFKIEILLSDENDSKNCFVSVNPGAGGTESQDWAELLLRMYYRYCEKHDFQVEVFDLQKGNDAGIKSATIFVKGKNAFGFLKCEIGVHRLVRISPFDANKRRHTSFAAVFVSPEVEDGVIQIKESDLKIDTYRSTGAGGQHVNTTDSAVRITHIPTGIVVQCQNERSQHQNKQKAMKMLHSKLYEVEQEKKRAAKDSVEKQKIEWGSQIRSYVLHPYKMVKDHRTDIESHDPDRVLDGDIDEFIEKYLTK